MAFNPPNVDQDDPKKMKFGQLQESLKWAQNKIFALGEAAPRTGTMVKAPNEFWVP